MYLSSPFLVRFGQKKEFIVPNIQIPSVLPITSASPDVLDLSDQGMENASLIQKTTHHAKKSWYMLKKVNLAHPACLAYKLMTDTARYRTESRVAFDPTTPYKLQDSLNPALLQAADDMILREIRFPADKRTDIRATTLSKDNVQPELYGWYAKAQPGKPTLIFANGKAGSLSHVEQFMEPLMREGYGFFAFDYRGFGSSQGKADEEGIYADFRGAIAYLNQNGVPNNSIILWGFSIGTAVVAETASRQTKENAFKAVLMMASFDTGRQVVKNTRKQLKKLFGPLAGAVCSLLPNEQKIIQGFDTIHKVKNIQSPLLMLHGDADWLAPYEQAKKVFEEAGSEDKTFATIQDGRHWLKVERVMPTVITYLKGLK